MGDTKPAQDKEKAAPRKPGAYAVLQQVDSGYEVIGSVEALTAGAAKAQVAKGMNIGEGESVTLVAVPAKSFKPQTYKVERPEPRLVAA